MSGGLRGRRAPARSRSRALLVAAAGALLAFGAGVHGQPEAGLPGSLSDLAVRLGESWRWRAFDTADGLTSNSIHALYHQDRESFIFAATDRGICRYSLWRWVVVPTEGTFVPGGRVRFVDSEGTLYVVAEKTLWRVVTGKLVKVPGFEGGSLFAAEDSGGAFVLDAVKHRYYRIQGMRVQPLTGAGAALPQGVTVLDYEIDATDEHWLATSQGLYRRRIAGWRFAHDRYFSRELSGMQCTQLFPVERARRSDGAGESSGSEDQLWGLFQSTGESGGATRFARLHDDFWSVHGELSQEHECRAQNDLVLESVVADAEGALLAATDQGHLLVSPDGCEWTEARLLGAGDVALQGAIVDSSGVVWFRQGTGGLAVFDAQSGRWEILPPDREPSFASVLSLLQTRDGDLWIGLPGGLSQYDATRQRTIFHDRVLDTDLRQVTGLEEDARGRVWVSSNDFSGAFVFSGERRQRPSVPGFSDYPISRIVRDVQDPRVVGWDLWFLSREEPRDSQEHHVLYRLSQEHAEREETPEPVEVHVDAGPINDLLLASDGNYWLATDEGLARARFDASALRFEIEQIYTSDHGLLVPGVLSIAEGPERSIWVLQPYSGVARIRGTTVENFTVENGLTNATVRSIARVGRSLWFATDEGLSRFSEDCWFHQPVAGRVGIVRVVRPALDELDGVLIGTHGHGAFRHRPQREGRPRFTLKSFPTQVEVGESAEFRWDARDYRNETDPSDLLYRYSLDGADWSTFAPTRSFVAAGLTPGSHSFHVQVTDIDGNRNRSPDAHHFEVVVAPGTPSAWWAFAVAAVALALVAAVSTRALVERARRIREWKRYGGFYRQFPSPVFLIDSSGRVVDFNGVAPGLVGLDGARQADILGRPLGLFPLFADDEMAGRLRELSEGHAFVLTRTVAGRQLEISGFPTVESDDLVRRATVIVRDQTERSQRRRLRERERRLTSLRKLADQVVFVVRGHLSDLRDWHGELLPHVPESERERQTGRLDSRVEHLEKLSRSLSVFSGASESGQVETIAPGPVIEEVTRRSLEEAQRDPVIARTSLRLDCRVQTGLWPVKARLESFADALSEILRNAWQALTQGGVVTVRASNLRLDDSNERGTLAPGSYVEITIQDTGIGITETQIEHVFDPFFSTRPQSSGASGVPGVGLSLAYGVVRSHGGDLLVVSQPERGTTVRIVWPAAR